MVPFSFSPCREIIRNAMAERKITLAIVSDEISQDFSTAVELALSWGINTFEIRSLNYRRGRLLTEREIELALAITQSFPVKISAISPGLFKIPLSSPELFHHQQEQLFSAFELARKFGTQRVIVFGLVKEEKRQRQTAISQVIDILGEAAEKAEKEGITLLLENEHICWADTGWQTAQILSAINSSTLAANWDPANAWLAGEKRAFPDGYTSIKPFLKNLHIKDVLSNSDGKAGFVAPGKGRLNWPEQLSAIVKDGFPGPYTIETHFTPRIKASRECVTAVRKWLFLDTRGKKNLTNQRSR